MRAFHFAWLSFFCAFVCWFAFAPLMVLVKADLELNLSQVFTTNILSVAGTVFCRFAIGPLCDKIGPKICQFSLLSWIAVFTLLGMSVNSFWSLCIVRFCIGFGGAAFVVTQYWTTTMFANNIVGTANATTAGWGNLMFKFGYIGRFSKGYEAMGYIIIASSIFSIFMRIKGQKTMFGTLEDQ